MQCNIIRKSFETVKCHMGNFPTHKKYKSCMYALAKNVLEPTIELTRIMVELGILLVQ